jgi:hypothetical protein
MYTVTKYSMPGWEKTFDTYNQAKECLYSYICHLCRDQDAITISSSIEDMLSTPCGCEFGVDKDDQDF